MPRRRVSLPLLAAGGALVLAGEVVLLLDAGLLPWLAANLGLVVTAAVLRVAWRRRGARRDQLGRFAGLRLPLRRRADPASPRASGRGPTGSRSSAGSRGGFRLPGFGGGRSSGGTGRGFRLPGMGSGRSSGGRSGSSGSASRGGFRLPNLGRRSSAPSSAGGRHSPARAVRDLIGGVRDGARLADRHQPTTGGKPPAAAQRPVQHPEKSQGRPTVGTKPRQSAPQRTENTVPNIRHDEDASLHRWGRNLQTVGPAIEEQARLAAKQAEVTDGLAAGMSKLVAQGESDLPADKTVVAETQAIAAEMRQIKAEQEAAAERLRTLAGRAGELGTTYRRNHEVDEARLAGERGGRAREKRADVTSAEQDT